MILKTLSAILCAVAAFYGLQAGDAMAKPKSAAILVDSHSGAVLYRERADDLRYPASLTKIMTLYLLFEAVDQGQLSLYTPIYVSKKAARQPPSKLGLKAGSRILVRDAILALVTKSANDVAVVVAEALSKNERFFAQRMTSRAHEIGMMKTRFRNASGLPNKGQVTTARDMALLSLALMRDFPHHYSHFSATSFRHEGRLYKNHNKLLRSYTGADGIKTGYTLASGYNLVASAIRGKQRLTAVIIGGSTGRARDRRAKDILDWGFKYSAPNKGDLWGHPALVQNKFLSNPSKGKSRKTETNKGYSQATQSISWRQSASHRQHQSPSLVAVNRTRITDWAIQIGAFSRYTLAQRVIEKARGHLRSSAGPTQPLVSPVHHRGTILYRARLLGFGQKSALAACALLSDHNIPCRPVR